MDTPVYAIGDIHGQLDQLDRALSLIEADGGPEAEIVILGDLVDRGPDSRGVIDRLVAARAAGRNWHILLGNHDRMFLNFLRLGRVDNNQIRSGLTWFHPRLGGLETLASYGIEGALGASLGEVLDQAIAAVPLAHRDFLDTCPLTLERGPLLFVHAGIRPGLALSEQVENDLIWIRDPFLQYRGPLPWLVVHGHTALQAPQHFGNRVDLDGGAGYGRLLHPAVFEGRDCWLLTESGRMPLLP